MAREPFRVFFPVGVLAGVAGVLLWPLYFKQVTSFYPGINHARLMANGFLGAFIFGFLGTAMPRMLSAKPLRTVEMISILLLYLGLIGSYASARVFWGDVLFLAALLLFIAFMLLRIGQRRDIPPPGFLLVALAIGCAAAGAGLGISEHYREVDPFWGTMQKLLSYQGFILLPILGIGPFLLPRFFGLPNPHDFPESRVPGQAWLKKAGLALAAGALIIGSFFIEANGSFRLAYGIRFTATLLYFVLEMPLKRAPKSGNALGLAIRLSLGGILAGFLAVAAFPAYRTGLLHLTLVGGFSVITIAVATRVVFGHSGNSKLLEKPNRWLFVVLGLMLFGMATRISGDFWPKIMASHYIYGAIIWAAAVLLWAICVLPKVLIADDER